MMTLHWLFPKLENAAHVQPHQPMLKAVPTHTLVDSNATFDWASSEPEYYFTRPLASHKVLGVAVSNR